MFRFTQSNSLLPLLSNAFNPELVEIVVPGILLTGPKGGIRRLFFVCKWDRTPLAQGK
jgi:hypothetical protein